MATILDFFAEAHAPHLHARGARATVLLLNALLPKEGQRILEIGFGTGQTLLEIAVRWPDSLLFGVEKSPKMLAAAQRRLRFCGLKKIELSLLEEGEPLPYAAGFFDAVYCESVLAIMPVFVLEKTFEEVFRVLKPGGAFVFNESVWHDETSKEKIEIINRECLERFGIVQASEEVAYAQDWLNLCVSKGFQMPEMLRLEKMPKILPALPPVQRPIVLFKSKIFSAVGALKSRLNSQLRQQRRKWRAHEQHFSRYGLFLEGILFETKKPEA